MKKFLFLGLCIIGLASCGSIDHKSQVAIKGDWTISQVSYANSDVIKVTSFDVADAKCFEGSMWNFVSNNNKGTMTISKSGCPSFTSPIVWTSTKDGAFTLKITEGEKAKRVTQGYILQLRNQTESSFELVDNVNVAGRTTEVVYRFTRV